jgi:dihydroflavonol-4-reductase
MKLNKLMEEKHRYFVTGGYGFLGQHIVSALCDHDPLAEVRVQVRSKHRLVIPIDFLPQVNIFTSDLSNPESYILHLDGVDTVIHNAALVSFKKSDQEAIYQSNFLDTQELIKHCVGRKVKNFIFISSISAIGIQPPKISDETMVPDNDRLERDPYGHSKLLCEMELEKYQGVMRIIILNPSVILGPGSQKITQIIRLIRYAPFIPMISTKNSFVDVRDVAQAVIQGLDKGRSGERYILTANNIDMIEFVKLVLQILDRKIPVLPVSKSVIRIADGAIDLLRFLKLELDIRKISEINIDKIYSNQKALNELEWHIEYPLDRTISDTISWINIDENRR